MAGDDLRYRPRHSPTSHQPLGVHVTWRASHSEPRVSTTERSCSAPLPEAVLRRRSVHHNEGATVSHRELHCPPSILLHTHVHRQLQSSSFHQLLQYLRPAAVPPTRLALPTLRSSGSTLRPATERYSQQK